jgi:hypothetical protein
LTVMPAMNVEKLKAVMHAVTVRRA